MIPDEYLTTPVAQSVTVSIPVSTLWRIIVYQTVCIVAMIVIAAWFWFTH